VSDALLPFGRGAAAPLAGRTILQILPPGAGGGDERATLAVAAALVEAGARALVASDSREFAAELQAAGGLHVPFPTATRSPLGLALNARRLAKLIAGEKIDLVHARSRTAAWVALRACRNPKRAVVTSVTGEGKASPPRSSFDRAAAEGDLVIALSEYAAERALAMFPAADGRLRIVRPGLDLAKLAPDAVSRERVAAVREGWGVAPHERVVLAPSRLATSRGQRLVIEAAARVKARGLEDIRFVIAGDAARPSYGRELDALAGERGVKAIVTRVGAPADRPAAFLAAAAVVFPALEAEGVARAPIEAAAIGALTIVADLGPAREIIVAPPYVLAEERTGWLVSPGDAAALAEAIEAALGLGASARQGVRLRARARVAEVHALGRMTEDTLKVYAEALRR
jgi:glycosyltransferase involved in cell wall biosynthesis